MNRFQIIPFACSILFSLLSACATSERQAANPVAASSPQGKAMPMPLRADELTLLPQQLPHWEIRDGKLHRDFRFADFVAAFAFMTKVALLAEKLEHHPDWSNVYNQVRIDLTTHDAGGVSQLDVELARQIDALLN